ncbi:MAG: FapA family protein [Lachnospiraceae bacterium]|nr:FapA family protein [Lachnospiraceae bacterium]
MEQKNAYVQLEVKSGNVYLIYHPPIDGGDKCEIKEVESYLTQQGFTSFSVQKLDQLLRKEEESEMPLGKSRFDFFAGTMVTYIEADELHCKSRVYPPSLGGNDLTKDDIIASLSSDMVKYGIKEDVIDEFVKSPVYFQDVVFAEGKAPIEGKDGSAKFYFNTDPTLEPKRNEDGSVDFHSLNVINICNEGDLLLEIVKEVRGENGTNLYGKNVEPKKVKPAQVEIGKNAKVSEDGTKVYSLVTGHVALVTGRLVVSDVYTVTGDVDTKTGDINYSGNVTIQGNVRTGFNVKAGGDVIVEGVVEDANIEALGQVIVKRGINSQGKGLIRAGSNVIAKFIENGHIICGGYVESGVLLASEVSAEGDVIVQGKKGFIAGCKVVSGGSVRADTIGSDMGALTTIEIGAKPQAKDLLKRIEKSNNKLEEEINRFSNIIANYTRSIKKGLKPDKKTSEYLIRITNALKEAQGYLDSNNKIKESVENKLAADANCRIVANRDVYPGTTLILYGHKKNIESQLSSCQFRCIDGEISRSVI